MEITKDKLVNAISQFIADDLSNDIRDASVKAMAIATSKILKRSPEIVDKVMKNKIISTVFDEQDGIIKTDTAEEILRSIVADQGKICLIITAIPLIHPEETKLGLTMQDLEKLFARMA